MLKYDGCVSRMGGCLGRWVAVCVWVKNGFWNFAVKILIKVLLISQLVCKTQDCALDMC